MGEVGVHLADELCAARQRLAKAGDVGRAEALLARPVEHRDVRVLGRQPVGDLPGAVGRGVVDDQHVAGRVQALAHRGDDGLEVRGLVVGGEDEPHRGTVLGVRGSHLDDALSGRRAFRRRAAYAVAYRPGMLS